MAQRPCMMCSAPLNALGDCDTPNCPYNPQSDAQEFEAQHEVVGTRIGDHDHDLDVDFVDGEPEMTPDEMRELLEDDGEADENLPGDESGKDAPEMDLSQENLPDQSEAEQPSDEDDLTQDELDELANEGKEKPKDDSENKPEDGKGQLDELPEDLPDEKETQLSEDEEGNDPSDDALDLPEPEDEFDRKVKEMMENRQMPEIPGMDSGEGEQEDSDDDSGLPPKPRGCNGDCKPTDDPSEDDVCCPHCTAKSFREEMQERQEEGEKFDQEELEEEWKNFLDDWAHEARDQKDGTREEGDGSGGDEGDAKEKDLPEDEPDADDELDDSLDQEYDDEDATPIEDDIPGQDDPEPDDLSDERYDEPDEQYDDERKDEPEAKDEPDDILEGDVPEEQPEGKGEGKPDPDLPPRPDGCQGECKPSDDPSEGDEPCPHCTAKQFKQELQDREQKGETPGEGEIAEMFQEFLDDWNKEQEQEQGKEKKLTREQIIEAVNEARDNFDVGIFEQLNELSDDELTGMFSSEELADFGDVAENNNAHTEAGRLRELAEQKSPDDEAPPEDEMNDAPEDEQGEDDEDEEPEDDNSPKKFKRVAKDMNVTQEKRFDNIVERMEKKVKQTFGQTAEDIYLMEKIGGQFDGEEVSQSIQISSRGVTYWVTISAAKEVK